MKHQPFGDPSVKAAFEGYPRDVRAGLLKLRALILATAAKTDGVGPLVETLKWGQPAYLPLKPKIGTTIRIDALRAQPERYAMFFHCQTSLVATFRELYRDVFAFEGNRAIHFFSGATLPRAPLQHCIALALTYRLNARRA